MKKLIKPAVFITIGLVIAFPPFSLTLLHHGAHNDSAVLPMVP